VSEEEQRLRRALEVIGDEAVFEDRFDVFAGWVRDVIGGVLAGDSPADAVRNADECAWAEEEVPDGWADHVWRRGAG